MKWLFLMSWRLSKRSRSKLLLFSLSIVLGTAAYVAIEGFENNIQHSIKEESKSLLGADLQLWSHHPFPDSSRAIIDSVPATQAEERFFSSMVTLPGGEVRLSQIHGLEGPYPFYGHIETTPVSSASTFRSKKAALVDQSLMAQYQLTVGDSIKIGALYFTIEGQLNKVPRQSAISSIFAPAVYIPMKYLEATDLMVEGSRIIYISYLKLHDPKELKKVYNHIADRLDIQNIQVSTHETRQARIGNAFGILGNYLNLIAFIALLLGGLGISGAVNTYTKQLRTQISTLKCIGVHSSKIIRIFLIQLTIISIVGAIIGVLLGIIIQFQLPRLFNEFIPMPITFQLSYQAMAKGLFLGATLSLLFSIPALVLTKNISAMQAIRNSSISNNQKSAIIWYLILVVFIYLFSVMQLESFKQAIIFCCGLAFLLILLWVIAALILKLTRKLASNVSHFQLRQSITNLHRPNNQTTMMIIGMGLGITIITTLFNIQAYLVNELSFQDDTSHPNLILFDIRNEQENSVKDLLTKHDISLIEETPIVSMRVVALNGKTENDIKKDSNSTISKRIFDREYRTTYRDHLSPTEMLINGVWTPRIDQQDEPVVSLESRTADMMGLKVGDYIQFNIQGLLYNIKVGSIRKVKWTSFNTNFTIVFPKGFLEDAPQFLAITAKSPSVNNKAQFQREVIKTFPNISTLDLDRVINSVSETIAKIVTAIQFLAYFSLLTGIIVLISSIHNTRLLRINESALLKTIGARSTLLNQINIYEFTILGLITTIIGVGAGIVLSGTLAYFLFDVYDTPDPFINSIIFICTIILITLTGYLSNRMNHSKTPLETLRNIE